MLSRTVAIAGLLIVLVVCAQVRTQRTQAGREGERSASASIFVTDEPPADVALIVCERDAVKLKDQVVRTERDGVHLLVENPGGAWGVDLHHESWAYGSSEGFQLKDEATPDTSGMGPGTATVSCLPTSRSSSSDPGVPTATLTIVDPDGLYVPWELACGFGEQLRMTIIGSEDEDPVSVVRRVPGVMSSDDLKRPNYPDSPRYYPVQFIVVRDGEQLAWVLGPYSDGGWHLIVNSCPGSGIPK
jgi:hypothetical protein